MTKNKPINANAAATQRKAEGSILSARFIHPDDIAEEMDRFFEVGCQYLNVCQLRKVMRVLCH